MASTAKGVALVTGAAQGIGKDISLRLASDGFDVAVNDIELKTDQLHKLCAEIIAMDRKCIVVAADVSAESEVKNMVETTVSNLGGLDVMISNAGIILGPKVIGEVTVQEWDRIFAINTRGTFLCYKYAALQMIKQGRGGRIIGASSIASKRGWENATAYSSSKFAVRGLTQATAAELGQYGITVNTYAPGFTDTQMLPTAAEAVDSDFDRATSILANLTPMKRIAQTTDIIGLVSFLVSPEASFITGQSININGGMFFD